MALIRTVDDVVEPLTTLQYITQVAHKNTSYLKQDIL